MDKSTIDQNQLSLYTKYFEELDSDGNGEIGRIYLQGMFKSFQGDDLDSGILAHIEMEDINASDHNGDGKLDKDEFINLMVLYKHEEQMLKCQRMKNKTSDPDADIKTFITSFFDAEDSDQERITLMLYFALTTLSTVGYGDYYPVSSVEMIFTSLVMLGGVAFFSYIMGNFIEILSNYDAKMGTIDKSEDLNDWLRSLERFTNKTKTNLSVSLVNSIISNMNYYWDHDRLGCYDEKDATFKLLPSHIKTEIIFRYLFRDIFDCHSRFFFSRSRPLMRADQEFLADIARGMMPRIFFSEHHTDKVIYEEDQEVAEMYFVNQGFIGIAMNTYTSAFNQSNFEYGRKQKGYQIICDHYVLNKRKSLYNYIAIEDVHSFGLTSKYLHETLFAKYKDYKVAMQLDAVRYYTNHVYKPLEKHRRECYHIQNQQNLNKHISVHKCMQE